MTRIKKPTRALIVSLGAGLLGSLLLAAVYFGLVSWAESPAHALEFFWTGRWIVIPILLGFGVQSALYVVLKKGYYLPVASPGPSGKMLGAGGATSGLAMAACCAHHVTDVLPILGLTAAASFLAEYRIPFMWIGFGMTLTGIAVMLVILFRERRKALRSFAYAEEAR